MDPVQVFEGDGVDHRSKEVRPVPPSRSPLPGGVGVQVEDGDIVVRIPIAMLSETDYLPACLFNSKTSRPVFKVTDPMTFAEEIAMRLRDEERGRLYAALDDALTTAVEEDADGIELEEG
jgi:hypothetical protein